MKTPATEAAASSNPARKRTKTRPAARRRTAENTYADPALRERLKMEIRQAAKGGEPGTWSARKSQLLTLAYQKAGGGYIQRHPNSKQKELTKPTDQNSKSAATKPARRLATPAQLANAEKKVPSVKKSVSAAAVSHAAPKAVRKQAS